MHKIVTSIKPDHETEAFLTPIAVNANALKCYRIQSVKQLEVQLAQNFELLERPLGVPVLIPEPLGPQILIVPPELGPRLSNYQPNTVSPHQIRICKMLDDLKGRPFARALGPPQLIGFAVANNPAELRGGASQHSDGILLTKEL